VASDLAALFLVDVLFFPPGWWQISLQPYQRSCWFISTGNTLISLRRAYTGGLQRMRERQFNDSHNVRQALISVGSGGLTGKGWRQGTECPGLPAARRGAQRLHFLRHC
jgi:cell division protein FtsW (lipid II flippase)